MDEVRTTYPPIKCNRWPWHNHPRPREYYLSETFRNGIKIDEVYMRYGIDAPERRESRKSWYDDGKLRSVTYGCKTNMLGENKYAIWNATGQKRWSQNGALVGMHMSRRIFDGSIDEPNILYWHPNGEKHVECWAINGYNFAHQFWHRKHGPAKLSWYDNGQQNKKEWWLHGKKHNENGAAVEKWDRDGAPIVTKHYIHGCKMSENEHREKTHPADVLYALRPLPLPIKNEIWHYYSHY